MSSFFQETFFGLLLSRSGSSSSSNDDRPTTFASGSHVEQQKLPPQPATPRDWASSHSSSSAASSAVSSAHHAAADAGHASPHSSQQNDVSDTVASTSPESDEKQQQQQLPLSVTASNKHEKKASGIDDKDNDDDIILVTWDGDHDPANPQNWPTCKKIWTTGVIMLLTTSVYSGSSIVTPAIPQLAQYFGVGLVPATLSLTLFVLAYGLGPIMGLCAASEIPAIGRTIPYVLTLFLFVVLQIPTALATSFAGYLVCRFLAGFFGSPPLATGGASIGDMYGYRHAAIGLAAWGISASAGPVVGPLIGGFASQSFGVEGWRWTIWPLLMLSGFTLIACLFALPETSSSNILARRAQRLRKQTGDSRYRSQGEIEAAAMTGREIAMMVMIRPFLLGLLEPAALGINLHIGMVYGCLYMWFEAFPIVFAETHGFNAGELGLSYLGIFVTNLLVLVVFILWFRRRYLPAYEAKAAKGEKLAPEIWLEPAMVGSFFLPLSLLAFGWTSSSSIHWIVPILASTLFSPGIFALFTSGLNYLVLCYPDHIASALSFNDFSRASIGAALPSSVGRAMFKNLHANNAPTDFPVAWGCTLLGCVAAAMVPIPFLLHRYGPQLRKASKYAATF